MLPRTDNAKRLIKFQYSGAMRAIPSILGAHTDVAAQRRRDQTAANMTKASCFAPFRNEHGLKGEKIKAKFRSLKKNLTP